jgi:hypothetical protein
MLEALLRTPAKMLRTPAQMLRTPVPMLRTPGSDPKYTKASVNAAITSVTDATDHAEGRAASVKDAGAATNEARDRCEGRQTNVKNAAQMLRTPDKC